MGGLKSVFLMGSFDEKTGKWYTVTKVGNGFVTILIMKIVSETIIILTIVLF